MQKQSGFSLVITLTVIVTIVVIGVVAWQVSGVNKPKIITKTVCSDVCPSNTRTYKVYKGVDGVEQCNKMNGRVIRDEAWGGFIGCEPK